MRARAHALVCVGLMLLLAACASPRTSRQARASQIRDPAEAQRLTAEATEIAITDMSRAEAMLHEALRHDLYHGPAHNNLGVIYLKRGDLYDAAAEFEWARKLMPGHPDPRLNLGITLERAGLADEALESYAKALEVYPGHIPTIQALVRCQIRYELTDERTPALLQRVAFAGTDPEWRSWAIQAKSRMDP